jgi:hypothetical protein
MSGIDVISSTETGRQSTLLVRGAPVGLGPEWEIIRPDLDAIVLAYLEGRTAHFEPGGGPAMAPVGSSQ